MYKGKEFRQEKVAGRCQFVKSRDQAESELTLSRSSWPGLREESWHTSASQMPPLGTPRGNEGAALGSTPPGGLIMTPYMTHLFDFFSLRTLNLIFLHVYFDWTASTNCWLLVYFFDSKLGDLICYLRQTGCL